MRTRPKARRWLWIALVASISLNILIGSFAATLLWRLDMPLVEATNPVRVINRAAAVLPAADRAILNEVYASRAPAFAAAEEKVMRARARVIDLIAQPDLDEAAIRAAIEEARAYRRETLDLLVDVVIETLKRMPPEHRRELLTSYPPR
jgi:uncharacterized membrane protein